MCMMFLRSVRLRDALQSDLDLGLFEECWIDAMLFLAVVGLLHLCWRACADMAQEEIQLNVRQ